MSGPCICGDICCNSCGPAQGNWRCPLCREWASEGCEHVSAGASAVNRKYQAQAAEIERQERLADDHHERAMNDMV